MCFSVKVNIRKTSLHATRLPWAKTCELLTTEHKDRCDALDLLQDHSKQHSKEESVPSHRENTERWLRIFLVSVTIALALRTHAICI